MDQRLYAAQSRSDARRSAGTGPGGGTLKVALDRGHSIPAAHRSHDPRIDAKIEHRSIGHHSLTHKVSTLNIYFEKEKNSTL